MITGPDVSRYQPTWTPAPTDDFVFVKATEGRTVTNPNMLEQAAAARMDALVVGFYHFLWPDNVAAQAAYFCQQADSRPGDLLVCDWEKTNGGVPTQADKDSFLAEVRRLRPENRVGLYVNASMWNNSNKQASDFLWIAHYGVTKPNIIEPWTFWQWTSEPIDQNYAQFATRDTLRSWAEALREDNMPLTDADLLKIRAIVQDELADILPHIWRSAKVDILKAPTDDNPANKWTPASMLEAIHNRVKSG